MGIPIFFWTYSLNKPQNVRRVNPSKSDPVDGGKNGIYWDLLGYHGKFQSKSHPVHGKTSSLTSFQTEPSHFSRGAVLTSSHRDLWDRELLNLCAAWLVTTVTVLLVSELLRSHLECQKAGIGSGQKKGVMEIIEVGSLIEV